MAEEVVAAGLEVVVMVTGAAELEEVVTSEGGGGVRAAVRMLEELVDGLKTSLDID